MSVQPFQIDYVSPLEDADPANDNIDIHLRMDDGRVYSLLVATPNNIYTCMDKQPGKLLLWCASQLRQSAGQKHIEEAINALLSEDDGRWLSIYGTLQVGLG